MSSKYPVNAADSLSFVLLLLGVIFVYFGYTQGQSGYTAIGLIEFFLALIQSYINRI